MITVPERIHKQVRTHATGLCRPERETVGLLIVRDNVAKQYQRVRNYSRTDLTFMVHLHNLGRVVVRGRPAHLGLTCHHHVRAHNREHPVLK